MTENKFNLTNQKGQALLFVVVSMTIALAVGVSVSLRSLSSVSRVATTDSAARVLAAAEGGAERFLSYPIDVLDTLTGEAYCDGVGYDISIPPECVITFDPIDANDKITARAIMTVTPFTDEDGVIDFSIKENNVKEISLDGYDRNEIYVCWYGNTADIYYFTYGYEGGGNVETDRRLLCPDAGCVSDQRNGVIANDNTPDCVGYDNIMHITNLNNIGTTPYGMRLRAIGDDVDARIVPNPAATLPIQGYEIISVGQLVENENVQARKIVKVIRSLPYLPIFFDYGIYAETGIVN